MTLDEEYSPKRKAGLIDNVLSCTALVSGVFDELASEERERVRRKVAKVVGDADVTLEKILEIYRAEVPGFAAKWRDLEACKSIESRRAALNSILSENYGSKLRSEG